MTISTTFVTGAIINGTGAHSTGGTTASGDLLAVFFCSLAIVGGTAPIVTSMSDNLGNTYTKQFFKNDVQHNVTQVGIQSMRAEIWTARSGTTSSGGLQITTNVDQACSSDASTGGPWAGFSGVDASSSLGNVYSGTVGLGTEWSSGFIFTDTAVARPQGPGARLAGFILSGINFANGVAYDPSGGSPMVSGALEFFTITGVGQPTGKVLVNGIGRTLGFSADTGGPSATPSNPVMAAVIAFQEVPFTKGGGPLWFSIS